MTKDAYWKAHEIEEFMDITDIVGLVIQWTGNHLALEMFNFATDQRKYV